MTAYLTLTDLEQAMGLRKLAQLSSDVPNPTAPHMPVVDAVIAAASEEVDGYLRARYVLPLDPVPTIIRNLTVHIACYSLYARRMESTVPETVKDQRDRSVKVLEHIQAGKVTLGHAKTHKAIPEAGAIRIKAPPKQFGEATLEKWRM